MDQNRNQKLKIVAGVGVAILLLCGGIASAFWTAAGSGNGEVGAGDVVGITVNLDTVVTGLYPGGPEVTLSGTFDNSNSGPVRVATVTAVFGTFASGCLAADFTIGGSATVGADIPTGNAQGSWTGLNIKMNNTEINQDPCKLSTIPLTFTSD